MKRGDRTTPGVLLRPRLYAGALHQESISCSLVSFRVIRGSCARDGNYHDPRKGQGEHTRIPERIFQEALTNILRHAQATKVDVAIKEEAGIFVLTVSDNGRGITAEDKSRLQSLGLLGMRERAYLIGAEIDITGVEGQGTVVTVRVPIPGQSRPK
jgi:glucose-6-phosphate-specific signal transduction histidine kinase